MELVRRTYNNHTASFRNKNKEKVMNSQSTSGS